MSPAGPRQPCTAHATTPEQAGQRLLFQALNQRIDALPDGPVAVLRSPRWQRWFDVAGAVPMALLLLLWLLLTLQWLAPAAWVPALALACLVSSVALWLPGRIRSLWVIGRDMRKGVGGFMRQWDHDLLAMEAVVDWLRGFPRVELERKRQQCQALQERMQHKLGFFSGGLERLGILPALVAAFYLLREREQLMALPAWLMLLGLTIVLFWWMGTQAARARLRLQLMASLLQEALHVPSAAHAPQADG